MNKPTIAQLLNASGHTTFPSAQVTRAINALYGDVGANLDERNWSVIMASSDPLTTAEAALRLQWQDRSYLLRNAHHLVGIGYPEFAPEITYRQMGQRLSYSYSPAWSEGSTFAANSLLSDAALQSMAVAYAAAVAVPTIGFNTPSTGASLVFSHGGTLSWSVSGPNTAVTAGTLALTPGAVGAPVNEGLLTLTRDNAVAGTTTAFVLVGTDAGLFRSYNAATPVRDRLILLGAGNDTITGSGNGNDTIYGGAGDDTLRANQGNDIVYGGTGQDNLEGGQGNDLVDGGADADFIFGGSSGADTLTGGTGGDQFRFETGNAGVTITDFSAAQGDKLSLLNGGANGAVTFAAALNQNGTALVAADFDAVASIANIRSDTGGANAGNNQAYLITTGQTAADIMAAVPAGATNAYALVYNSSTQRAVLVFDADWSTAAGRVEIATLTGLTLSDVQALTIGQFLAWQNA